MTLHFRTESNSIYEFDNSGSRIRRLPEPRFTFEREAPNTLRGDREWVPLLKAPNLELGKPAVMLLQLPGVTGPTIRTTSPIERIWHDDEEIAA